jgi:hypothetical protein
LALSWLLGKAMLLSGNPLRVLVVSPADRRKARSSGAPLTARLLTDDRQEVESRVFQAHPRTPGRLRIDTYFVELTPTRASSTLRLERGSEYEELHRPVEVLGDNERVALVLAMQEAFTSSPLIGDQGALQRLTRRVLRDRVPRIWLRDRFVAGDQLKTNVSWAGPPVPSAPVNWATEALVAELFDVAVFGARAIDLSTSVTNGVLQLGARVQAADDQLFSESLRLALRERNELIALYEAATARFRPVVDVREGLVQIDIRLELGTGTTPIPQLR